MTTITSTTLRKLVIANWKQNKTLEEALTWCGEFGRLIEGVEGGTRVNLDAVTVVVCPPAPFVDKVAGALKPLGVAVGVQDVSPFADGAHTGFIGVNQVKKYCNYAIVGHSERQEDRQLVHQKAQLCLGAGITPLVCFKSPDQYKIMDGAIYALEDPQNISQNGVYQAKSLAEVQKLVDEARKFFGDEATLIYGGSVNEENAGELATVLELDGVLVGNASLNPVTFADIVGKFSL